MAGQYRLPKQADGGDTVAVEQALEFLFSGAQWRGVFHGQLSPPVREETKDQHADEVADDGAQHDHHGVNPATMPITEPKYDSTKGIAAMAITPRN